MRLQILMLPKNDEDGFARINENTTLDKVEHPFSQTRRQENFEAQTALSGLFAQRLSLRDVARAVGGHPPISLRVRIIHVDIVGHGAG